MLRIADSIYGAQKCLWIVDCFIKNRKCLGSAMLHIADHSEVPLNSARFVFTISY